MERRPHNSGGDSSDEEVDERECSGNPCGTLDRILKGFVQSCLCRNLQCLWPGLDQDERRLRRRCLRDRLCRQAQEKYWQVVSSGHAGAWAAYLRTPQGRARITQWVDRKVAEVEGKRANRARAA